MKDYKPIAESNNFIVLDQYTQCAQNNPSYQSERSLENELIQDLENACEPALTAMTKVKIICFFCLASNIFFAISGNSKSSIIFDL